MVTPMIRTFALRNCIDASVSLVDGHWLTLSTDAQRETETE